MKIIVFQLLDLKDNTFKKVYFRKWGGKTPIFCENKKFAKKYSDWEEKTMEKDIKKLKIAKSDRAITLSVRQKEEC